VRRRNEYQSKGGWGVKADIICEWAAGKTA